MSSKELDKIREQIGNGLLKDLVAKENMPLKLKLKLWLQRIKIHILY